MSGFIPTTVQALRYEVTPSFIASRDSMQITKIVATTTAVMVQKHDSDVAMNNTLNRHIAAAGSGLDRQRRHQCEKSPYFAKGDHSTDDTAAIQAAINASSNAKIFLPRGEYMLKNTLTSEFLHGAVRLAQEHQPPAGGRGRFCGVQEQPDTPSPSSAAMIRPRWMG
jgi:hypothetical protein